MSTKELIAALPKLWRYCLGLTQRRADADDLAQAACLRALEQIERFKEHDFPDRWLIKVARNLWLNQLKADRVRRGGGLVPVDRLDLEDLATSPELDMFTSQVFSAVMSLPEAQRDTVLLTYVEGYSYKETAEIQDIPIGTVMSRLADARRKLSVLKYETSIDSGHLGKENERHGSL
jgi:RNA polymerase sigma-70 factor (ECF subfamily)